MFFLLLITLVLILIQPSVVLPAGPGGPAIHPGVFSEKALEVHVNAPASFTFHEFKARENLSINVANPTGTQMAAYIALYRHHKWYVLGKLGEVGPGENKTFVYPVSFSYHGRTKERAEFGVAGKADGTYAGNTFYVSQDWGPYENGIKSTLSLFGIPLAGLMLAILAVILAGVYSSTGHEHRTVRSAASLIARPAELMSRMITSPLFWLFELACGAVLVSIILSYALSDITPGIGLLVFLVGGAAAIFLPVIFLVAAWMLKFYRRRPFGLMASMFTWGVMATLFAFLINTACTLQLDMALGKTVALAVAAVAVGPIVEETTKGTGVLILSGRRGFGGTLDGILYGFAVGMGFAVIENWLYFAVNANPVEAGGIAGWAYDILYRSVFCSLAHGCFTGATGGMIGHFKASHRVEGFAFEGFYYGLPIAIVLHSMFNMGSVLSQIAPTAFGIPVPLFDPLLTLAIVAVYICLGVYLQLKEGPASSKAG
jgi:RsiW-degrading membrane proteinase PrsW (M82 family)